MKLKVHDALAGFADRQRAREAKRRRYQENTTRDPLPMNAPIRLGVPRVEATFETPRTHAAHVEFRGVRP